MLSRAFEELGLSSAAAVVEEEGALLKAELDPAEEAEAEEAEEVGLDVAEAMEVLGTAVNYVLFYSNNTFDINIFQK